MRVSSIIILFGLLIVPLTWNAINFIHYLVEHTHTFCDSDFSHHHTSTEDCQTICHFTPQHQQNKIPNKVEFYELKQCISSISYYSIEHVDLFQLSTNLNYIPLYGRDNVNSIFRPPIS